MTDLLVALYRVMRVSRSLPHAVPARALRTAVICGSDVTGAVQGRELQVNPVLTTGTED